MHISRKSGTAALSSTCKVVKAFKTRLLVTTPDAESMPCYHSLQGSGSTRLPLQKHLVFECPEFECFRQQWSHLFQGPRTMQAFMWQDDNIGIARFISACLRKTREGQTSDQPGVAGRDVI